VPVGILPVIGVDRAAAKPLYRQLYEGYRDAVVERRLRAGQRLPSTRSLAGELEISRIPVLSAFEQLLAEGYFESRIGSGTFVARSLPEEISRPARPAAERNAMLPRARREVAHRMYALLGQGPRPWFRGLGAFSVGQPPVDRFPVKVWSTLVARHSREPSPSLLHYGDPLGLTALREAVAEYLRTARALRCEAEQVMIVNGSQQAIELSARVLLDPDSPVWVEEPGYFGAHRVLKLAGARATPVPVDDEGLDVSAGIAQCPRARAVFVTPSHQFPLGVTMSASRRLRLLDWARRSGSWVIEDDYDSEYRYGNLPIGALQGLDRNSRVIYIGTFTKILFPAIRLGYMVLPADLVGHFVDVRRAMDVFSPTFHQAVLTDFIREGHFARHIRRTRLLCRERRSALVNAIQDQLGGVLQVLGDQAGMFLAATFQDGRRDREISERAARHGLWAAPLSDSYLGKARRQGFILGYGGTSVAEIVDGVCQLRKVISSA
ncbi:MAG: PLP-dependent aminotransferase family protein, partial [Thermoanaerobaculia bacterium]